MQQAVEFIGNINLFVMRDFYDAEIYNFYCIFTSKIDFLHYFLWYYRECNIMCIFKMKIYDFLSSIVNEGVVSKIYQ